MFFTKKCNYFSWATRWNHLFLSQSQYKQSYCTLKFQSSNPWVVSEGVFLFRIDSHKRGSRLSSITKMWFELLINLRQVSFKCIWKLNMSYDCNISNTCDISMRFWKCFKYSEILNTLDFTESQHSRSGRSSYLGNWTCLMIVISLTLMIFQWGFGNLCYDEYRGTFVWSLQKSDCGL